MECDPLAFALAALFSAAKLEDEFVAAVELAKAVLGEGEGAEAMEKQVLAAEPTLLAGFQRPTTRVISIEGIPFFVCLRMDTRLRRALK